MKKYFQLKKEATRLMTEGEIALYFKKLYEIEAIKLELVSPDNNQRNRFNS
ncbi:MAG: hypothetical protein HKN22_05060 [Bacteroidia bacterium]|nr:hypothetical protein [Bacteroidia bacterium]